MVFSGEPARVVRSWSGPGTCETVYEDQYGRVWRTVIAPPSNTGTTGVTVGRLRNGIIEEYSP